MQINLITGISGSGKSVALRAFEDAGYDCVDNLPVSLLENLIHTLEKENSEQVAVAIVQNRKARAVAALIVGITIAILFPILRYSLTGCETKLGIAIAAVTFVPLGVAGYYMASFSGARNGDIFGITSAILPAYSTNPPIMACTAS